MTKHNSPNYLNDYNIGFREYDNDYEKVMYNRSKQRLETAIKSIQQYSQSANHNNTVETASSLRSNHSDTENQASNKIISIKSTSGISGEVEDETRLTKTVTFKHPVASIPRASFKDITNSMQQTSTHSTNNKSQNGEHLINLFSTDDFPEDSSSSTDNEDDDEEVENIIVLEDDDNESVENWLLGTNRDRGQPNCDYGAPHLPTYDPLTGDKLVLAGLASSGSPVLVQHRANAEPIYIGENTISSISSPLDLLASAAENSIPVVCSRIGLEQHDSGQENVITSQPENDQQQQADEVDQPEEPEQPEGENVHRSTHEFVSRLLSQRLRREWSGKFGRAGRPSPLVTSPVVCASDIQSSPSPTLAGLPSAENSLHSLPNEVSEEGRSNETHHHRFSATRILNSKFGSMILGSARFSNRDRSDNNSAVATEEAPQDDLPPEYHQATQDSIGLQIPTLPLNGDYSSTRNSDYSVSGVAGETNATGIQNAGTVVSQTANNLQALRNSSNNEGSDASSQVSFLNLIDFELLTNPRILEVESQHPSLVLVEENEQQLQQVPVTITTETANTSRSSVNEAGNASSEAQIVSAGEISSAGGATTAVESDSGTTLLGSSSSPSAETNINRDTNEENSASVLDNQLRQADILQQQSIHDRIFTQNRNNTLLENNNSISTATRTVRITNTLQSSRNTTFAFFSRQPSSTVAPQANDWSVRPDNNNNNNNNNSNATTAPSAQTAHQRNFHFRPPASQFSSYASLEQHPFYRATIASPANAPPLPPYDLSEPENGAAKGLWAELKKIGKNFSSYFSCDVSSSQVVSTDSQGIVQLPQNQQENSNGLQWGSAVLMSRQIRDSITHPEVSNPRRRNIFHHFRRRQEEEEEVREEEEENNNGTEIQGSFQQLQQEEAESPMPLPDYSIDWTQLSVASRQNRQNPVNYLWTSLRGRPGRVEQQQQPVVAEGNREQPKTMWTKISDWFVGATTCVWDLNPELDIRAR